MKLADLENKRILLVGYGKEGKATETFLKKNVPSANLTVADSSQGVGYLALQNKFDFAIKSPGVHATDLMIPYTTATNLFFEKVKGTTIGITGTKGKSTTASLIYAMLKEGGKSVHLVGNIGNPMLSELLLSNTKDDVWVCELSSYQLSDIVYSPHIAVITSLFPEHMNYHGSIEAYYEAKARIVAYMTDKDYVVYDPQNTAVTALLEETKAMQIPFLPTLPFPESTIPLLGKHNRDNVRAAVTAAQLLELPEAVVTEAVGSFAALPHRLQLVGEYKNIAFYDDAISTTPQSTIAALESLSPVGTLFLGGEDRGYDFTPLIEKLVSLQIPNLVFFPKSGGKIKTLLEEQETYKPKTLTTTSMKEAVAFSYTESPQGSICLLSCASPSYTLWKNFEVKGDEFQKFVKELGQ